MPSPFIFLQDPKIDMFLRRGLNAAELANQGNMKGKKKMLGNEGKMKGTRKEN